MCLYVKSTAIALYDFTIGLLVFVGHSDTAIVFSKGSNLFQVASVWDRNPWIHCSLLDSSSFPLPLPLIGRSPLRKTIRKYIFILQGEKIVCIQRHLQEKKQQHKTLYVIAMGLLLYCRQSAVDPHLFNRNSPRCAEEFERFCCKCWWKNEQKLQKC